MILSQYSLAHFSVREIRDVVLELVIKPVAEQLKLFPDLVTSEEADLLGNLLLEDFDREALANERSFVLGDTWTGAILVTPPTILAERAFSMSVASPAVVPTVVGVINWEFATFGRGPHGDMAQFLAHFELLRISAQQDPKLRQHEQALDMVIEALTTAYSTTSFRTEEAVYQQMCMRRPQPLSLLARKLRSAFPHPQC